MGRDLQRNKMDTFLNVLYTDQSFQSGLVTKVDRFMICNTSLSDPCSREVQSNLMKQINDI